MGDDVNKEKWSLILKRFNKRDSSAFAEVYKMFFVELHAYAIRLYRSTSVDPQDAVQEAFIVLWERADMEFDSLANIKAFIYAIIKNQYGHYYEHLHVENKYRETIINENHFSDEVEESEMVASLTEYIERIPDPGKEVMRLYLKGYEAEDIAQKMNFNIQTIYNIKSKAINQLRLLFKKKKDSPLL